MLDSLLQIPKTEQEWNNWSWSHRVSHTKIRDAIQAQFTTNLFEYDLDPIPLNQYDQFLRQNAQAHQDMNGVLELQGTDLEGVDFKDDQQREDWFNRHYQEHYDAQAKLKV